MVQVRAQFNDHIIFCPHGEVLLKSLCSRQHLETCVQHREVLLGALLGLDGQFHRLAELHLSGTH